MFAFIEGAFKGVRGDAIIVGVNRIGYKIFVTSYSRGKISTMNTVKLHVHTYVREDTLALYGFLELDELEMFELLISVSGIGPKAALGILSIADPKTLRTAILNEDPSILTRVSGVGKRTAERVILELQNKVGDLSPEDKNLATSDSEALEALTAMGYTVAEAREALKNIPDDIGDLSEKIKYAFKNLGNK